MSRSKAQREQSQKLYDLRARGHHRVNSHLREAEQAYQEAKRRYNIAHRLIEKLPPVFLKAQTGFGWSSDGVSAKIPWDWNLCKEIEEALLKIGFEKSHEWDTSDKADKYIYFRVKDQEQYFFTVCVVMDGDFEAQEETEKACVLVPLKTEQKTVVVAYDHVCPDEHPELFTKDEFGKWIYIGDNVFPAVVK